MSQAITRRTLQTLKARELREKASGAGLATTDTKSALVDRIYRHSRSAASTQLAPEGARPPPTPSRGRGGASSTSASEAADWRLTVQLMVEQSLQGMEERLLRSLQPEISGIEDAGNLSLPSPNQGTHSHETVAPRPDADAAAHPSGREDAAVVTCASPQLTVRQPPVPAKVKQRILRGEFVDFDNLLSEALYPARHGASPLPLVRAAPVDRPRRRRGNGDRAAKTSVPPGSARLSFMAGGMERLHNRPGRALSRSCSPLAGLPAHNLRR